MSDTFFDLVPRPLPPLLSLVIPIFNEEEVLPLLIPRLREILNTLSCPSEVILVDDGSSDRSIQILLKESESDSRLKVLALARNFGHQLAATAGLDFSRGEAVILMDADLQDPPELISAMLEKYCQGFDVVYAKRTAREGETWFKKATAWAFYRIMRRLIHKDLPVDVGDYRLMSRPCLDALQSMRETHRFLRGMVAWIGFPQTSVEFIRPRRAAGETKYPLSKMLLFAWNAALSFSPLPLRLIFGAGMTLAIGSFSYGLFAMGATFWGLDVVRGWASSIAVTCFIGGTILVSIGLLGEYVAKIYEQVKERPLYVVARTKNFPPKA
ncbi:glycosyltransferase family 2 protein [Geothrix oryzisoli]|uniref:glycosyltransferase family 2 protein n=1 Tax=Geothrix oryzisoli TaxID=2922721 RepID=UPI001FACCDC4|nr:glycosyltransferase family 2 protein [Geothrix oryzisoli]